MVNLNNLPSSEWWCIKKIDHNLQLCKELERMGLFEGVHIRKVRNEFLGGPGAYEFLGSCCMIRGDLAEKIFCIPIV